MERRGIIVAIVGLPASGKSYYGKELSRNLNSIFIDDPKNWDELKAILIANTTPYAIIADPYFCITGNRKIAGKRFKALGYRVRWIYFENNPLQCQRNALYRENKLVTKAIDLFTKEYVIPKNAKTIRPVWT